MASKQLTASVRLNTSDFESKLKRIARSIDALHNSVRKGSSAYEAVNRALLKSSDTTDKIKRKTDDVKRKTDEVAKSANKVHTNFRKSDGVLGSMGRKLKGLAATYLGIMGAKAVAQTADTITGAENRLNALNGGDAVLTQQQMDKMYVSSQKVRMNYGDMIANASKSMTLAGDAFQGNMDNAIRFQEIMAEAYTLGGASAAEQSSSMYQMIQALGAGTLAGDELRSVREGAPLAYKAIEEFAQGVYGTTDSLKDMASQGLITSDMVVAAIMSNGDKLDEMFKNTKTTFGQTMNMIKNTAIKAFEPVLQKLTSILSSDKMQSIIFGLGNALLILADVVGWVFSVLGKFFSWCADNWSWLQYIVIFALVTMATYYIYTAGVAVISAIKAAIAWLIVHWQLVAIIAIIALVVTAIIWLANTTVSGCEFMIIALTAVALAVLLIGIITGSTAMVVIAIILAVVAVIVLALAYAGEEIMGVVFATGAVINNVVAGILNVILGVLAFISAGVYNRIAGIVNFAMGLWNVIVAVAENIGIAFENAWIFAQNTFWTFVEGVLRGLQAIAQPISDLASLIGLDFSLNGVISSVSGKQQSYRDFKDVGNAWSNGMNTMSYANVDQAVQSASNTFDYVDVGEAYNKGAEFGASIEQGIDDFGNTIKDTVGGLSLDNMGNMLTGGGREYTAAEKVSNTLGNLGDAGTIGDYGVLPSGDAYDVSGAYKPQTDLLADIEDNTGDVKDQLELAEDDLEFLRDIANMEWRNEFTTAEIKVDMTNNNNVSSEMDMDGMVSHLSKVLREEMTRLAYGV